MYIGTIYNKNGKPARTTKEYEYIDTKPLEEFLQYLYSKDENFNNNNVEKNS